MFRRRWRHQHARDRRKPHRSGMSPALGLRLRDCPNIVTQTSSESAMNRETATMIPQFPDAAADAPSVPATAPDVVAILASSAMMRGSKKRQDDRFSS